MSLGHGASIARDGIEFQLDSENIKSYSGSGNWIDMVTKTSGESTFGNPSWASNMSAFSASLFITIHGSDTAYAYNPISKWSSTTNASFVLYHFQQHTTNTSTNRLGWYANVGGSWAGIGNQYVTTPGNTYHVGLQYGSTTGAQMWINGEKVGSRSGHRGTLGSNSNNITIDGGISGRSGIHTVKNVALYSVDISDKEMIKNFNAIRGRYGI